MQRLSGKTCVVTGTACGIGHAISKAFRAEGAIVIVTGREHRMAAFVADAPLKRFGLPVEVAALAVMLGSDDATYITGAELTIDGGLLAGSAASLK